MDESRFPSRLAPFPELRRPRQRDDDGAAVSEWETLEYAFTELDSARAEYVLYAGRYYAYRRELEAQSQLGAGEIPTLEPDASGSSGGGAAISAECELRVLWAKTQVAQSLLKAETVRDRIREACSKLELRTVGPAPLAAPLRPDFARPAVDSSIESARTGPADGVEPGGAGRPLKHHAGR